ncbi:alpha/beta fold hydrolase [Actinacidiphila soli]|uniref:alpha/beta fold hydrolase n=1 Tax=Actinacidiphila soli TaxID=2487275 RepID=UPI000FCB04A6|nr:alpha/beta hydrolase [Actinacidiphila soli]
MITEGRHTGAELAALQRRITPFFWHRWDESGQAEYRTEHTPAHPWLREAFYAGSATGETLAKRIARLAAVPAPVLVLAGAADGMIGTAPARAVAACYPNSRLEVLRCSGHRPWVEEPEQFTALVTAFLAADRKPGDQGRPCGGPVPPDRAQPSDEPPPIPAPRAWSPAVHSGPDDSS